LVPIQILFSSPSFLRNIAYHSHRLPFILREIEIIATSAHPNIVAYINSFRVADELWVQETALKQTNTCTPVYLPTCHWMPAACCLLPAACCLLPAACCLLPAACCLLPATCCLLPAACCLLPAACCLLPSIQLLLAGG
jgi:hypothetical protein